MLKKELKFTKTDGTKVYKLDYFNDYVQDCDCEMGCDKCCGSMLVDYEPEYTATIYAEDGEIVNVETFKYLPDAEDWIKNSLPDYYSISWDITDSMTCEIIKEG